MWCVRSCRVEDVPPRCAQALGVNARSRGSKMEPGDNVRTGHSASSHQRISSSVVTVNTVPACTEMAMVGRRLARRPPGRPGHQPSVTTNCRTGPPGGTHPVRSAAVRADRGCGRLPRPRGGTHSLAAMGALLPMIGRGTRPSVRVRTLAEGRLPPPLGGRGQDQASGNRRRPAIPAPLVPCCESSRWVVDGLTAVEFT